MSAEDRLLAVREVAERLSLSVKTVRLFLRTGRIRGIKTGSAGQAQWRVAESELDRYQRNGPAIDGARY